MKKKIIEITVAFKNLKNVYSYLYYIQFKSKILKYIGLTLKQKTSLHRIS